MVKQCASDTISIQINPKAAIGMFLLRAEHAKDQRFPLTLQNVYAARWGMEIGGLFGFAKGVSSLGSSRYDNASAEEKFKLAMRSTGTWGMIGAGCFGLIRASWEFWKGDICQKESA
jgi:hypothetical protein